jgi:peptidoglycan hydrolase-like protein with peptidoglycan-binding domain
MPLLPPPAPPATPPTEPVAAIAPGHVRLRLERVGGRPLLALTGERVVVRGVVRPYVAGQKVLVRFYRNGRRVAAKTADVLATVHGAGQFRVSYTSPVGGLVGARAEHAASPQQAAFSASSPPVRFVRADMRLGSSGPEVRLLQEELAAWHYAIPVNGVYDEATGRAVVAYRKVVGLARVESVNAGLFHALQHGEGSFRVRYRGDGRHVEADLSRQVLAEIEAGGRVRRIYTMSSGKLSTPTVVGRFRVYTKTPGTNAKGMVDSNYFIRGYAIHGYAEVPTYAASHGCLRIPIPDAPAVFAWVALGTPVDVYFDGGGGSHSVRGNAGP